MGQRGFTGFQRGLNGGIEKEVISSGRCPPSHDSSADFNRAWVVHLEKTLIEGEKGNIHYEGGDLLLRANAPLL